MIGCAVIGGIVLLLAGIGRCSSSSDSANNMASSLFDQNMSAAIAAQSPPPIEPLNATSIARGTAHLRLAVAAEGFSGAMIYSQNCYDALSRQFTWAKLDVCGVFDALTARSIESGDMTGLDSEASWFQSETAASRYLAAATGTGEGPAEADTRLGQLQGRVARVRAARPRPVADNADAGNGETDLGNIVGNVLDEPMDELGPDE